MPIKNPTPFNRKLLKRLFSKIRISPEHFYKGTPCWDWAAARNESGYGMFAYKDRDSDNCMPLAHHVICLLFVGRGEGRWHADHLCRRRCCVNPIHLEPVTPAENSLRGDSLWAQNARKTHCINGHPFTKTNTYRMPSAPDQRQCRACAIDRATAREKRLREELKKLPHDHPERQAYRARNADKERNQRARMKALPVDDPERVAFFARKAKAMRDYHAKKRPHKINP